MNRRESFRLLMGFACSSPLWANDDDVLGPVNIHEFEEVAKRNPDFGIEERQRPEAPTTHRQSIPAGSCGDWIAIWTAKKKGASSAPCPA